LTFLVGTTLLNRVIDRFDITFHSRTSHTPDGGFVLGPALGSTATFAHQCPESE
jgi:hypothetical protein